MYHVLSCKAYTPLKKDILWTKYRDFFFLRERKKRSPGRTRIKKLIRTESSSSRRGYQMSKDVTVRPCSIRCWYAIGRFADQIGDTVCAFHLRCCSMLGKPYWILQMDTNVSAVSFAFSLPLFISLFLTLSSPSLHQNFPNSSRHAQIFDEMDEDRAKSGTLKFISLNCDEFRSSYLSSDLVWSTANTEDNIIIFFFFI